VGVYGQGGNESPGVVGQAGPGRFADGVQGFGNGSFSGVAGFGGADHGTGDGPGTGVFGLGGGPNGPGVRGIGAGGPNTTASGPAGVYGQAGPGADGVQGIGSGAFGAGAHGISTDLDSNGIIGDANNGSFAYAVWGRSSSGFAGFFDGKVQINGDLNVTGAKSAVVAFADGSYRLHRLESPESWFEDFGVRQLVNGQAQIQLDPNFASVVNADAYHVFLTEYEDNNALFVTNRTSTGFGVRAKGSMTAGGTFSYRVVAKRKDIATARFQQVTLPHEKMQAKLGSAGLPVAGAPSAPARPIM
jgi:hypothetical protein